MYQQTKETHYFSVYSFRKEHLKNNLNIFVFKWIMWQKSINAVILFINMTTVIQFLGDRSGIFS